jgi:prevent-host-death family protein
MVTPIVREQIMNKMLESSEINKKIVKVSELKAKCLGLVADVARTGQDVVITKRGEPVARLVPYQMTPRNARGIWKGKVEIVGDIISPVDIEWDALK